jgi:hypothetical protein
MGSMMGNSVSYAHSLQQQQQHPALIAGSKGQGRSLFAGLDAISQAAKQWQTSTSTSCM